MNNAYLKSIFLSILIPTLNFAQEYYPLNTKKIQTVIYNFYSNGYPEIYFPLGMHCLLSVSAFGDSLDIEDGSRWKIAPSDASKVASWGSQDPLIITQNHDWFSRYNYRIINHATGGILLANLHLGPFQNGPFTRYILSINTILGEIVLTDHTRWRISALDNDAMSNWHVNDAIIIGYNTGLDTDCQGLLINVNENQHARAAQF